MAQANTKRGRGLGLASSGAPEIVNSQKRKTMATNHRIPNPSASSLLRCRDENPAVSASSPSALSADNCASARGSVICQILIWLVKLSLFPNTHPRWGRHGKEPRRRNDDV
jgi:hypothetical protein